MSSPNSDSAGIHAEFEAKLAALSSNTGRLEDRHATASASLKAQAKFVKFLKFWDRWMLESLAEAQTTTSEAQTALTHDLEKFDGLISQALAAYSKAQNIRLQTEIAQSHDFEEFVTTMREARAAARKARKIAFDALYEDDKPRREYLHTEASRISEVERSNTVLTSKVVELEEAVEQRDVENTSLIARISEVERSNTVLTSKVLELEKTVEQRDTENISLVAEAQAAKAESDALRTRLDSLLDLFGLE